MFFDFAEVDEEITKKIVKQFLSKYQSIKRIAGGRTPNITATFSITPRSETNVTSDPTARAAESTIRAQELLDDIHNAINVLTDDSRRVLYFKYISEDRRYNYEIFEDLMISKDTYYRWLGNAQIEFAEAFRGGGLVVYEGDQPDKDLIKEVLS